MCSPEVFQSEPQELRLHRTIANPGFLHFSLPFILTWSLSVITAVWLPDRRWLVSGGHGHVSESAKVYADALPKPNDDRVMVTLSRRSVRILIPGRSDLFRHLQNVKL